MRGCGTMERAKGLWATYVGALKELWGEERIARRDKLRESWRLLEILVVGGLSARIPRLVWYKDECEVEIFFDASRVPSEKIFEMEKTLHEIGIKMDCGFGRDMQMPGDYYVWHLDSLPENPLSVRFIRKGKRTGDNGF